MMLGDPLFAIPTCRLRDVVATVEAYDRHFSEHGHKPRLVVFDDSGPALQQRYLSALTRIETRCELYYVGHGEKAVLKRFLCEQLRDTRLIPLIGDLFRPSYGGNRNFTLLYSLGRMLISADDDMRPFAYVEDDGRKLAAQEVCRGKVVRADAVPQETRTFDILSSFLTVLGKTAAQAPSEYMHGELLIDTAMDLETNASRGFVRDNALILRPGEIEGSAVVKMAQTYRSGTNDIDALDFVDMFLDNETQPSADSLADIYVLSSFRPVITNKNWRMDCGVAGYDNRAGLPPFFPTRLRCEDYGYRLWVQQPGVLAAHVPAAQNHSKSAYMRNPPASEVLNEEIANYMKKKIHDSITDLRPLGFSFDYDGEISSEDAEQILDKIVHLKDRVLAASERCKDERRVEELLRLAFTLDSAFYGFDCDLFQYNVRRTLKENISSIKSSLQLWPQLLEICEQSARKNELPQTRIGLGERN